MSIATSYIQSWLEDPSSIKSLFVVVSPQFNSGTTAAPTWATAVQYLSTVGYITTDGVTGYNPILTQGIQFTESISLDGSTNLTYGDLQVRNPNGDYDTWLNSAFWIWANSTVQIYLGDPSWVFATQAALVAGSLLIFDGVVRDIDCKSRELLNIKLVDKLQRLNTPLTESKLGTYGTWSGGQTNQDTIKPVVFGEVFNITPLLIDPSIRQYKVNDGVTENIIEVRDNGVPVSIVSDLTNGNFTLTSGATVSQITASVQGIKKHIDLTTGTVVATYSTTNSVENTPAHMIALIVTQYGNVNTGVKFTASDLDLVNLAAFAASNTQAIGYYVTDRTNILNICQDIATSVGAQLYMTRAGKLQLLRLGVGFTNTAITTITDADILLHTLTVSNRVPPVAACSLACCRNWTVQTNLQTSIPALAKDNYALEYLTVTNTEIVGATSTRTLYKLDADPVAKNTALIVSSDAATEAGRLRTYFSTIKTVYKFTGRANLLALQLGQYVTLIHNRFNLYNSGAGVQGQVITLTANWLKGTIEVEVII